MAVVHGNVTHVVLKWFLKLKLGDKKNPRLFMSWKDSLTGFYSNNESRGYFENDFLSFWVDNENRKHIARVFN